MISSTANPHIKQLAAWQTKARERKKDGVFVAEGRKMLEEAPKEWIREIYLSETLKQRLETSTIEKEQMLFCKIQEAGYEIVADHVMEKVSDTQTPQGVLMVMERPLYHLEELLTAENGLYLLLENLQDPGNLGTIIRTGEGAGITGVIMSDDTADIYNPKTIRATMGSLYRVPFLYVENLRAVMERMHEKGIGTYAAHLQGQEYYDVFSYREPAAFLIGNEGNGLREETARAAQHYLKIPMEGRLESLNAGVAAALLLYEANRQRRHSTFEY